MGIPSFCRDLKIEEKLETDKGIGEGNGFKVIALESNPEISRERGIFIFIEEFINELIVI